MKTFRRIMYFSAALAGAVGSVAVALGWEPPLSLVAAAAFLALVYSACARDTQAEANR